MAAAGCAADFVQKHRPVIGQLESPDALGNGTGEGSQATFNMLAAEGAL